MAKSFDQNAIVGCPHRTPNELIHLIRKLRWMGFDEEANRVQAQLDVSDLLRGDVAIADLGDTD